MKAIGRFIPEFEEHHGTIAMFPFRTDIWRDNAKFIQEYVVNLTQVISRYERVYLFCQEADLPYLDYLQNESIELVPMEYDDIWARDISPAFIEENGNVICICWKFNSWGGVKWGSYSPWDKDAQFAKRIAEYFGLETRKGNLVVEGGAIMSDGLGTVFTTRSVLLNRNRNPFKSFEYVDAVLKESLYARKIVWLDQGLAFDETNGHIDNVLHVIRPHEICLAWTDDKENPNYKRVRRIEIILSKNYDCNIHKLMLPTSQYMTSQESNGLSQNKNSLNRNAGDLLPASYLNFYMVNGAVIVPSFDCPEDDLAMEVFIKVFPDRNIEQIYSREPLLGGGGIHCILHEIPKLGG